MNKRIKMIITDLDGTLLRDDKTVSDRNRLALLRCRELGIKVIFATGRSCQTKVISKDLFDGYVCCNGAYAYAGETIVYQRTFSNETTRFIVEACTQRGIAAEPRQDEEVCLPVIKPGDAEFVNSILPDNLYLIVLKENYGQIMHKEATKVKAVEALARHWGIEQFEIVAFGDDLNDIDMLSWVGVGVAMGNAVDEVITASDEVCLNNENDGIAVWIEKNISSVLMRIQ